MRQLHELMTEKCVKIRDTLDQARRMARSGETGPQLVDLLDNAWGMALNAARFYGVPTESDLATPLTPAGVVSALTPVPTEAHEAIDSIITCDEVPC